MTDTMPLLNISGLRVFVSPLVQPRRRYTLDPQHKVPMTDAFRAEMEAWAMDFFKPEEVAFVSGDKCFVSPKHMVVLRGLK
jgi:hypothetical protein